MVLPQLRICNEEGKARGASVIAISMACNACNMCSWRIQCMEQMYLVDAKIAWGYLKDVVCQSSTRLEPCVEPLYSGGHIEIEDCRGAKDCIKRFAGELSMLYVSF